MTKGRVQQIRAALQSELSPEALEIEDESHLHAGHAGARDGRGHFRVTIVTAEFVGLNRIQRHRRVYTALGGLMQSDIHALTIQAFTPEEL